MWPLRGILTATATWGHPLFGGGGRRRWLNGTAPLRKNKKWEGMDKMTRKERKTCRREARRGFPRKMHKGCYGKREWRSVWNWPRRFCGFYVKWLI
tara:strand:+ start:22669 stop:22956 length:288 start_codon:yes stop_codon:yes gene_type:complete